MARGNAAAGDRGGGAAVQALRLARTRLIAASGAVAALAGAGAVAATGGARSWPVAAGAAGLGLLVLTAALALRAPSAVGWAVLVCGAGYPAGRHGGSDVWAATAGALLLLAAELASWSIDEDSRIETERPVLLRRGAFVTALALGSFVVGLMLLAAAHVAAGASLVVAGAGVLAAVVAVAVVLRLVRGVGGQTRV